MKSKSMILALLILSVGLVGCTGDEDHEEDEGPDWVNERGNASQAWNISLEEVECIEVKSAISLGLKDGKYYSGTSYILSESGYRVMAGFSPIFGGNYSFCGYEELSSDGCVTFDNDGEVSYDEWSIIYRIHEV